MEQLLAAGIDVEIGLCEEDAARLNECYFKFITGRGPFVHGIIEYPPEPPGSAGWTPSPEFLDAVSEYDSLVLGPGLNLNRLLIEGWLKREHHRAFVIAGGADEAENYRDLSGDERGERVVFITLPTRAGLRAVDAPNASASNLADRSAEPDFDATLEVLSRMGVTGVLVVSGIFDPKIPGTFESFDKLTLAIPGRQEANHTAMTTSRLTFADLEFDLEEASVLEAGAYTEFTGYPRLRGVA